MTKYPVEDFFADKQPERSFQELDAPLYESLPKNWNQRSVAKGEVALFLYS